MRNFRLDNTTKRGAEWFKKHSHEMIFGEPPDEKNPLCACGCGIEVARPWHVRVLGHSRRKLTPEQVEEIVRLLDEGNSQNKIAKLFGVSQGRINQIKYTRRLVQNPPKYRMRKADSLAYAVLVEVKKCLRKTRRTMEEKKDE